MGGTLFAVLEGAVHADPGKPALIHRGEAMSYAVFLQRVRANAARIVRCARREGPVALFLADEPDFLVAFFAAMAAGRPALVLDPMAPRPVLDRLLRRVAPALLVAGKAGVHNLPVFGGDVLSIEARTPLPGALPHGGPEDEFYWGLTSGTTGASKIFARTHRSWLETFRLAEAVFDFSPADRIGIIGSLSHSLFLYGSVHALCRGMTVILSAPFRPLRVARELIEHQASVIYGVPVMFEALLKTGLAGNAHCLRRIFSSGAKLSQELRVDLERAFFGVDIVETYGASELSYVSYASTHAPASPGSVGRLFPQVQIEIRGGNGAKNSAHTPGMIWVKSPMLFSRYVGEAPEPGLAGGWASAGDIGFLDADGFLHLGGRAERTINSMGRKIQPEVIEEALLSREDIQQVCVVALADPKRGQRVAAVIVPAKGCLQRPSALRTYCRETIGESFVPHAFFVARGLPVTRSGKIAVKELCAAIACGDPAYEELE